MRERTLAALEARLRRIRETGDISLALQPQVDLEMQQLAGLLRNSTSDLAVGHALGWICYFRSLVLPDDTGRANREDAITALTPCFLAGVGGFPKPLLPELADAAVPHALELLKQAAGSADPDLPSSTVGLWQRIVRGVSSDHVDRAAMLSCLEDALRTRFERTGDRADLDQAIDAAREAVRITPVSDLNRAGMLTNLGCALRERFDHTGNPTDLDEAIAHQRAATYVASVGHPARAVTRTNLGSALLTRFQRTGNRADLDEAVAHHQAAVQAVPVGHPARAPVLTNLGSALGERFEYTGNQADLDAAIAHQRAAVDVASADHPARTRMLSNLGSALLTRFRRTGNRADLDEAITHSQAAVQATSVGHPDRAGMLTDLGGALWARFEHLGGQADFDEAIAARREAVEASPAGHPHRAMHLSNLGVALWARFERLGGQADLDEAIDLGREAVRLTPADHPRRAGALSNLGSALLSRFECMVNRTDLTGRRADLQEAIAHCRAAVDAAPADHPDRAGTLSNLGRALWARFELRRGDADLGEAIDLGREAVRLTPADDPRRAGMLCSLGFALYARFKRAGRQADLDDAVSAYTEAGGLTSAAPSVRVRAARTVLTLIWESDAEGAADAAEAAVRLLPEVAPRRLARSDQQHALGGLAGLAADAAALALADPRGTGQERATRALRLLEAGRAVLLSQALDARSDLTDLQQQHPDLAARFVDQRDRLDQPAGAFVLDSMDTKHDAFVPRGEHVVKDRHHLARDFSETLDAIRELHGFASFGLPPTVEEILTQAEHGSVVVFNTSRYRSDALFLHQGSITHQELPGLPAHVLAEKVTSFHRALDTAELGADKAERRRAQAVIVRTLEWLWDAAAGPVLATLGHHGQPQAEADWPRVWWVPGGLLGLLPLHAAGYHTDAPDDPHRRTVMDRVVSSYTPTVRALRYARQHTSTQDVPEQALVVAMPTTPGLPGNRRLNHVKAEAEALRHHLQRTLVLSEPDPADHPAAPPSHPPTKATVLRHLPTSPIVHFACHGTSDATDPSRSRLLLHDHTSDPLTVASLAPVRLDRAQLAYLSACRTAAIDTRELLDEAIHLTSAFQLAGFPHVIGTLWEIDDQVAVTIADAFYTHLRSEDGAIDTSRAAWALHQAVRGVRDGHDLPGDLNRTQVPFLWAAYLHAGT